MTTEKYKFSYEIDFQGINTTAMFIGLVKFFEEEEATANFKSSIRTYFSTENVSREEFENLTIKTEVDKSYRLKNFDTSKNKKTSQGKDWLESRLKKQEAVQICFEKPETNEQLIIGYSQKKPETIYLSGLANKKLEKFVKKEFENNFIINENSSIADLFEKD